MHQPMLSLEGPSQDARLPTFVAWRHKVANGWAQGCNRDSFVKELTVYTCHHCAASSLCCGFMLNK